MRVVYLHQYFVTPQMSGGTRSYEMARRLVADGHEVHMITADRTGGARRDEVIDGIRVTWIPAKYSNNMGTLQRVWAFLLFAIKSSGTAARSEADIVFATSTPLTIAIPGIWAKWRQRIPVVLEIRDPWPEMLVGMGALTNPLMIWVMNRFKKFAYSQSRRIIALSDGMKDTIVASGYDEDRITVVPNTSDVARFSLDADAALEVRNQYSWLGDRKLVLYAGALGYANAVGYLVELAREVKKIDPEIRFLTVGGGAEEQKVSVQAQAVGVLNDNFFMLPRVAKSDVPKLFSAASICTVLLRDVPELWTNSSNKFFDALASGRPVVVNNVGWQQELLEAHNAGFHVHPTDISAAAQKLVEALQNDTWLDEAGKNARELATGMFDTNLLYRRFRQVLLDSAKLTQE